MARIQIIAIIISLCFTTYVFRKIIKSKLREEFAIAWIIATVVLILFSFWRNGLEIVAKFFGVVEAPNLFFAMAFIFIFIYLLRLSITVSSLTKKNKELAQQIALLHNKLDTFSKK